MADQPHILLLEDDEVDQIGFNRFVKNTDFPYSYDIAGSIQEAKTLMDMKSYDAVVMDYRLPDGTAEDIWKELESTPYLIITGLGDIEIAVHAMKSGAADFIVKDNSGKNLHLKTLQVSIEKAIRTKEAEEELEQYRNHLEALVKDRTAALQQSERKFKQIFHDSPTANLVVDLDFNISMVNRKACQMFACEEADLVSKPLVSFSYVDDAAVLEKIMQDLRDGKDTQMHLEHRFQCKDSDVIWGILNYTLIDDGEKPLFYIFQLVDVTTEKRIEAEKNNLQDQLLQSQKMEAVGQLAGGIAHDFNNILTVIQGNAQLALTHLEKPNQSRHEIKQISSAAERAADLTRQLLLFSRRQQMEFKVLEINELVENVLAMLKRLIGEDVEIFTELDENAGPIFGDPGHIEQVLINLFVNSRDAMPEGGQIELSTDNVELTKNDLKGKTGIKPGRFVRIRIQDNGTGISREELDKIFEPFYSTKSHEHRAGLGLSAVFGIISQHQGFIQVDSEPGTGTTFELYFPVTAEKEKERTEYTPGEMSGSGQTILLIEDDIGVLSFIESALQGEGYNILSATRPSEALDTVLEENVDLILSDVVMPEMTGIELVKRLKKRGLEIPIIFSSGYTADKSNLAWIQENDFDFIQKPFSLVDLLKLVNKNLH